MWRDGVVETGGGDGMVAFSSRPRFLLPFAPEDKRLWTEDHYMIYDEVQIAIGQRRKLTEKEIQEQAQMAKIDAIESGESEESILDVMRDMFGNGEDDISAFLDDPRHMEMIEQQLKNEEAEEVSLDYD